jgi:hypothetical protein
VEPHTALLDAKKIHSVDGCLSVIAQHLNKYHMLDIHPSDLSDVLSLISLKDQSAQAVWEYACNHLIDKKIDGIQVIDFPDGQERSRLISLNQLPKAGFTFWKKPSIPPLADMLSL